MEFASVVPAHLAKPLSFEPFDAVFLAESRVGDPRAVRAIARPYPDVTERLEAWEAERLITRADRPALYVHEYATGGLTVRGLVGALRLTHRATATAEQGLLPHERIHPEQAQDLAAKMFSIDVNPAPILLSMHGSTAYRDLLSAVTTTPPLEAFTDRNGQQHRVWQVPAGSVEHELRAEVATTTCIVADGHHRYAAYLALQQAHPGTGWDLGLAMVVDQSDTPFFLGPIHRTLRGTSLDELVDRAERLGVRTTAATRQAAVDTLPHRRIVATDGNHWLSLAPPNDDGTLLVEWLHSTLVPDLSPDEFGYHHTLEDALRSLGESGSTALILPAPAYDAVARVVEAGHLLPEKATSFQPKPTVAVIMRPVLPR
ncbi:MAG: DUF1015 family protein [Nocardioides sp.]|uniref:DUF1015 family protein n=1 Tax=Nocardioides sp. TaxID=35761 RepID=UPI003F09C061